MINYVLGFMFDESRKNVVLIHKNRPDILKGKLNGVGGKVETFDKDIYYSMVREYEEETGVTTRPDDWYRFTKILASDSGYGCDFMINCFYCFHDFYYSQSKTVTDEEIEKLNISFLREHAVVHHAHWLIPMAINFKQGIQPKMYLIHSLNHSDL